MGINYFAYGSNMSVPRLSSRIDIIENLGIYKLAGHKLLFHKVSRKDGTGKCNAFKTNSVDDFVLGLVFEISDSEKPNLDRLEGLGFGYMESKVEITSILDGSKLEAQTYIATNIDDNLKPFDWYKYHVLYGAKSALLPQEYIDAIDEFVSINDKNKERQKEELCIYE